MSSSLPRHVHAYLNDYIRLADTKAAAVFVVASGMVSILVSTSPHWNASHPNVPKAIWFSSAVFINVVAALTSLLIVTPRLVRGTSRGLIFWRDILVFESAESYAKASASITEASADEHIARHNWVLAQIADRKYRLLRLAFVLAAFGLLTSVPFAAVY